MLKDFFKIDRCYNKTGHGEAFDELEKLISIQLTTNGQKP